MLAEQQVNYDDDFYTLISKVNDLLPDGTKIEIEDAEHDGFEIIRLAKSE